MNTENKSTESRRPATIRKPKTERKRSCRHHIAETGKLPLIPMLSEVLMPGCIESFDVGRTMSLHALNMAAETSKELLLTLQKTDQSEIGQDQLIDPAMLAKVGVKVTILQLLRLAADHFRVFVRVDARVKLVGIVNKVTHLESSYVETKDECSIGKKDKAGKRKTAHGKFLLKAFREYAMLNDILDEDYYNILKNLDDMGDLTNKIVGYMPTLKADTKQSFLEDLDPESRAVKLIDVLNHEVFYARIEQDISRKVKDSLDESQRKYYLRAKLNAIKEELEEGDQEDKLLAQTSNDGSADKDVTKFLQRLAAVKAISKADRQMLKEEIQRLAKMAPQYPDYNVLYSWLDTVLSLPFDHSDKVRYDIKNARKVLDRNHYGLTEVKDRIIEHIAVMQLKHQKAEAETKNIAGKSDFPAASAKRRAPRSTNMSDKPQILCLIGPPGVGKTSIVKSMAEALGLKYIRLSLGGVSDEAEIRGHRKTYVGAMSGRIMQAIRQCGSNNPVFLLDEIDKLSADYKGDPAAALLEVLDPEQNNNFRDNYLEIPFDLSKVFFITTANTADTIPEALYDRMDVIEVSGYTEEEKLCIAKKHLLPKVLRQSGLTSSELRLSPTAMLKLISGYTSESGVRQLERELMNLCRKVAVKIAEDGKTRFAITGNNLQEFLGVVKYTYDPADSTDQVGVARGLAYTSVGGDTLSIEVNVTPGSGKLQLTGKLGDVMKESAQAALTYIRSQAEVLGLDLENIQNEDIHIHVPAGAIPKDGPSAGITLATALASALTGKPVYHDLAMTGEITLRGLVLPIGGLKEKSAAAARARIKRVIIPAENAKDLSEIPESITSKLEFIKVHNMAEVLKLALKN